MRDILLSLIVFGVLPFILASPRLGAYVWAWLSLMNPHRLAWGFSRNFPFAYIVAVSTLLGFLFSGKERKSFPVNSITVVYVLFILWMSVTSLFAINSPEIVLDRWIFVHKIHLMLLVTLMLIRGRDQIEKLVWIVTLSIGFYGLKGGVWTVLTGGGTGRVWGPADTMIEDNNGLALALVVLVPFMYYLYQVSSARLIRLGLLLMGVAMCFSILGSQSRGALLALFAMAFMLALKSKRPALMGVLLSCLLAGAIVFMPDSWSNRMETIETHQEDASAQSRFYSWTTMWNLAVDRPLVGGGFESHNDTVYALYAPTEGYESFVRRAYVAHSIYFQALGEHGFPGLMLYLLLGLCAWRKAGQLARRTRDDPEFGAWVPVLMRMTQVSLIGFAVGGAFLSLVHFDLPYYIVAFVVLVDGSLRERARQTESGRLPARGMAPLQASR